MFARRKFIHVAALAGAAALVAQSGAFAADKTEVKLASTVRQVFDNLPLYVAEQGGQFDKHGLAVQIAHFSGGGEVVRAVVSGTSDVGMVAATSAILAIGTGQKLKIISGYTAPSFGVLYIVKADSPIRSVKDLAGKTVGFSRPGSVSHTALIAALNAEGITDKVTMIPTGSPGDSLAALKTGRIQASWFNAIQAYELIEKNEARILFGADKYLSDYQQGSFIATEAYLAKHGDTVRKFLAAVADAIKFTEQNPAQAAKFGAKDLGASEQHVVINLKAAPKDWWRIGAPREKDLAGAMAEAEATGSLKQKPSYDTMVDKRFLP